MDRHTPDHFLKEHSAPTMRTKTSTNLPSLAKMIMIFLSTHRVVGALQLQMSSSFLAKQSPRFAPKRSLCTSRPSPFRRTTPTMMPEGPEVRTLVDQLQPAVGQRLTDLNFLSGRYTKHGMPRGFDEFWPTMTKPSSDDGEKGSIDQTIDRVVEWHAKGKFIYIILDNGNVAPTLENGSDEKDGYLRSIWITLGMSGRFINDSIIREDNNARWSLEFWNEKNGKKRKIYYLDTRNFGTLRFSLSKRELMDKLDSLGPDILDDCTEDVFMEVMNKAKPGLNVCKFLMNQKVS